MISVTAAKHILAAEVSPLTATSMALEQATGATLASDVHSLIDLPPFVQSSVDGYAFKFDQWQPGRQLPITGVAAAGTSAKLALVPGSAMRIFTGAPVPAGADTIIMQENCSVADGQLLINDAPVNRGANVRLQGTDIKTGGLALPAGTQLTPAALGFLAGLGMTEAFVYRKPLVSIIVTGTELRRPGSALEHGEIYESNSPMLRAALRQLSFGEAPVAVAEDDPALLTRVFSAELERSDVVLLTGGVSVGDYDFVLQAAANCGVQTLFHKVLQRPGKPLFCGKKGKTLVFGLPGNPSSVLCCFYEYVLPALQQLSGNRHGGLPKMYVPLAAAVSTPVHLTCFLKGFFDGKRAIALDGQESYRLSSFARANCLIVIDSGVDHCPQGAIVEIHLLPAT